ncbi:MAG: hypothetical protein HYZ46_05055, partial [Nitrosomonadales bacterium]|nr:hypothetical protein [Nitrosomonadales bacterium]
MNQRKSLEYLALAALLVTFFGYFSVKVWDIDFWWHIAAGKHILESGAVPGSDPFGVYDAANVWGQTVLKSQWLGQVMLYSIYSHFDLDGVIWMRAVILSLCLAIVYWRCRLAATTGLFSLSVTALAGLTIMAHTGERPQLFSFLYLSLIFLLLDGYMHRARRWLLYCIPLVMLLWSNTHAGSVLGVVALGLYGTGLLLEKRRPGGPWLTQASKSIFAVVGLSAIAMACTPNGLATIHRVLFVENVFFAGGNPLRDRVSEYAYPWLVWSTTKYYWVFMATTVAALPGFIDRTYWKHGLVVVTIALISLTGYRYIPLFVLLAAPYVAASLNRMLSRISLSATAVNLSALMIALACLGYGFRQDRMFQHGMQEHRFPAGAAAFIKDNHLGGRIFNTMNWGGYLTWQLQNTATVFIDGRMLDPKRLVPYTHILWVTPEGRSFFEQGDFDLVLIPYSNMFSNEQYPLVNYLLSHPGWRTAYRDDNGYLFVRD